MTVRRFPADVSAVRAARIFVIDNLREVSPTELDLDATAVLVSELASNSVLHADSEFEVSVEVEDDCVRVGVTDAGDGEPTVRDVDTTAPSGRGLHIVDALADRWGIEPRGSGKTVWFELLLRRTQPLA